MTVGRLQLDYFTHGYSLAALFERDIGFRC
jgi:hypothetical protein